ncbi:MAG: hypothetical protein HZA06_01610 [Nitrospirae bacterium]|nr:hypothetical protein [Nitrospirota bacterium]
MKRMWGVKKVFSFMFLALTVFATSAFALTPEEILLLKKSGVSDEKISEMQKKEGDASPQPAPAPKDEKVLEMQKKEKEVKEEPAQPAPQPVIVYDRPEGKFSIGAFGGGAWSMADHAAEGTRSTYPNTQFEADGLNAYGGSLMYKFPRGFALEVAVERISMDLVETGYNFGTLDMMPIMFLLKFQGYPRDGRGLTGHIQIGAGWSLNSFEKGKYITDLERTYRATYTIDTDDSFVFELGGGLDIFFVKYVSLSLDLKLLLSNVGTSWKVSSGTATSTVDITTFYASNIQALIGLRFWF